MEAGQKKGKAVVVAGCVPQGAPKTGFLHGLSVVGVQQIDRVVEVVEETLKGTRCKGDSLTGVMKYCYQRLPVKHFIVYRDCIFCKFC